MDGPNYGDRYDQRYLYPFNSYHFSTVFVVLDLATGLPLPILRATVADQTSTFDPDPEDWESVLPPINVTMTGPGGIPSRSVRVVFRRMWTLVAFVVTLFIINWALTIAVVWVAVVAVDALVGGKDVPEFIIALPISVILVIPGTRTLWMGAPPFGELNT